MRALRRELFDGEEVFASARLHVVRLLGPILFLVAVALAAIAGVLISSEKGFERSVVASGAAVLVGFFVLRLLTHVVRWRGERVVVTNRRLIQMAGVLSRKVTSLPLVDISEVNVRRSLVGRLVGYGELVVVTPNGSRRLRRLSRPHDLHRAVAAGLRPPRAAPSRRIATTRPITDAIENAEREPRLTLARGPEVARFDRPRSVRRSLRHPSEGQLIGERYLLVRSLASGGMGRVFEGHDQLLSRRVAVKLVREELSGDAALVERFRREARAAASLAHPNIASIFDYGEDGDTPYIVMELVRGPDLAQLLSQAGVLSVPRAVALTRQLLDALQHAHEAGIVHRDVKPANVIVDDNGVVKVTDFGIARAAGESKLTLTGVALGSAPYASPEQVDGRPVGPVSDVYSTGIVLFEMLTGEPPFRGEPLVAAYRHIGDEIHPPSGKRPEIPGWLDAVVMKATARDPRHRFSSALEMAASMLSGVTSESPSNTAVLRPASEAATLRLVEPDDV